MKNKKYKIPTKEDLEKEGWIFCKKYIDIGVASSWKPKNAIPTNWFFTTSNLKEYLLSI